MSSLNPALHLTPPIKAKCQAFTGRTEDGWLDILPLIMKYVYEEFSSDSQAALSLSLSVCVRTRPCCRRPLSAIVGSTGGTLLLRRGCSRHGGAVIAMQLPQLAKRQLTVGPCADTHIKRNITESFVSDNNSNIIPL